MASKKAVLLGINNYQYVSDLRGCISDVEKFKALLRDEYRYSESHIHQLTDEQVIKSNIAKEWDWLLKGSKSGDQLVFMFAGHGSQIADFDDDEPDGVDELLCLHDMDFDNPESYLLDDDVYRFTKRLPEGVALTIIFDCCHSGTATRMLLAPGNRRDVASAKAPLVDLRASLARARADRSLSRSLRDEGAEAVERLLEPRTVEEERQTVLARYIDPPPRVLELLHRKGTRRGFQKPRSGARRKMNHVFYAASQSGQTSADAYIDHGYHGAFSYYFCKAARTNPGVDQQRLLAEVRSSLAEANFSQVPQLEPETTSGPLLGAKPKAAADTRPASTETATAASGIEGPIGQQILGLLSEILDQLKQRPAVTRRELRGRALVYVHGICKHEAGYSQGWWEALRSHLSPELAAQVEHNRPEVLWSHIVTPERALAREMVPAAALREAEQREQQLTNLLRDIVEDRAQQAALDDLPAGQRDVAPRAAGLTLDRGLLEATGLECIDDFTKYLARNVIRREVQRAFLDVVRPLLESGVDVDIMSHSWGTVVAYESLRTLDHRALPGQVFNLFTIGSALSMVPVQRLLETDGFGRPTNVGRWINLDAKRDFVGGSLRSLGYGVDKEYLNLDPVGCRLFFDNPWCPHSSYFRAENTAVNRDIFAAHMES